MRISDEIRKWCGICRDSCIDEDDCDKLRALADRIDRELVELPKDADGREVTLDTKVLYDANGKRMPITSFTFSCGTNGCWSDWKAFSPDARSDDGMLYVDSLYLTTPDSLERIADELEEWREDNRVNGSDEVFFRAGDLAERIRRLADKESQR